MKKLLTFLFITSVAIGLLAHTGYTLFAAIPTPLLVPPQAKPQLTEEQAQKAFEAKIRNTKNKLETIMREVQFAYSP